MRNERIRGPGSIYFWQGGSLWIGRTSGTTDTHAHHAIQISLALEGSFGLRTPDDADWESYTAAIVPSHQSHAFRTSDALVGSTFLEPEAHEGRALLERFGNSGIVALPAHLAERSSAVLRSANDENADDAQVALAVQEVVGILTDGAMPREVVDPRIQKAIELVKQRLAGPVLQEEIADAVFLSPSRFRHLFVEETGMAFRPYVLWLRLHSALRYYVSGETLTTAAHAAGFADLAHLSRTFRRMFGISPAMLEQIDAYAPIHRRKD